MALTNSLEMLLNAASVIDRLSEQLQRSILATNIDLLLEASQTVDAQHHVSSLISANGSTGSTSVQDESACHDHLPASSTVQATSTVSALDSNSNQTTPSWSITPAPATSASTTLENLSSTVPAQIESIPQPGIFTTSKPSRSQLPKRSPEIVKSSPKGSRKKSIITDENTSPSPSVSSPSTQVEVTSAKPKKCPKNAKILVQQRYPMSERLQTKLILQQCNAQMHSSSVSSDPTEPVSSQTDRTILKLVIDPESANVQPISGHSGITSDKPMSTDFCRTSSSIFRQSKTPLDSSNIATQVQEEPDEKMAEINRLMDSICLNSEEDEVVQTKSGRTSRILVDPSWLILDPADHLWFCNNCTEYFIDNKEFVLHIYQTRHIGFHAKIPLEKEDATKKKKGQVNKKNAESQIHKNQSIDTDEKLNSFYQIGTLGRDSDNSDSVPSEVLSKASDSSDSSMLDSAPESASVILADHQYAGPSPTKLNSQQISPKYVAIDPNQANVSSFLRNPTKITRITLLPKSSADIASGSTSALSLGPGPKRVNAINAHQVTYPIKRQCSKESVLVVSTNQTISKNATESSFVASG